MFGVRRSVRQKVVAVAAVAVVLAGGAFAAVSATGQSNRHRHAHARHGARHLRPRDLAAAAAYLGVPTSRLSSELGSSKSLAQIAEAHAGKSAQGVVEAIVAARRARLAKLSSNLPKRVGAEVNRSGGAGSGAREGSGEARGAQRESRLGLFTAARHLGGAAAAYLGLSSAQLRSELGAGKTLAQIADATAGKSKAGLLDALVAAKQQQLSSRQAEGGLTKARAARKLQRLNKRMGALLERRFARGAGA
jgi:hypothetical protein